MTQYDVVIAGGAVMGSSVAYHLAALADFGGRVLVVEKDPTYQKCASALSAASIRQQYSSRINIQASLYGIEFLRNIAAPLSVDGEAPQIGLREGGYLYVAPPGGAEMLAETQALQRAEGADILLLDRAALAHRFPWLNVTDLELGSWGRSGEGWFDGWGLMQSLRRKARALGADYLHGEVVDVVRNGDRVTAVVLADGSRIGCGTLVNAAGAGGPALAERAGVRIPVYSKKRCIFTFACKAPPANCPLLIDTSGVWVRPEGGGFLSGVSPADLDETDHAADFEVDWPLFEEVIWPALAHRVPAFEELRQGRAWAGHYDMNLFDHNAIVGPAGDVRNLLLANGFSGHGLQQSPAVGRGLAELIVYGRYMSLDLSDFAFDRIAQNRPVLERNII
jgi:FAD-dependent oxidoreductase domain-containing protein 1